MSRLVALLVLTGCADPTPAGVEHAFSAAQPDSIAFAVLGDVGTGYPNQHAVGAALADVCAARAADASVPDCALVLLAGDNIYDSGANSVDDSRFIDRFEEPYADLALPFFVVSGNHDWGWHGFGPSVLWEREKLNVQIAYSDHSEKWTFPGRYWSAKEEGGLVRFIGLDSTSLLWTADEDQHAWAAAQATTDETWRFAWLHHTILSNGKHGNAGAYPAEEGADGTALQALFEEHLCPNLDAVFTGHDHDLQWHEASCGTHVIVSGAAGKSRPLRDSSDQQNPDPLFQVGQTGDDGTETDQLGFLLVELSGNTFTGTFYDQDGQVLFTHSFERRTR